jgi:hypothetical protein
MPIVLLDVTNFPTIQTITNLVRSDVRDDMAGATDTIGEGQILVDNLSTSVTLANFFNSAVRELCHDMRLQSAPALIGDNYIIRNIPPMNGPQGLAVADPSVQVAIYPAPQGYFDGTQWHGSYCLPEGVYEVIRCWERETSSNDTFADMGEPADGMAGVYQAQGFGSWEWRQGGIWLPGSLDNRDLRIRWLMALNAQMVANADPATTYLPIMGCEEAVARKIGRLYARRQGGGMYEMASAESKMATDMFLNEIIHRKQGTEYVTLGYGAEDPPVINFGQ